MLFIKDNQELRKLAESCIKKYPLLENLKFYYKNVKIGFQWADSNKIKNDRVIYGDCERVKPKLKQFIDYDFVITFYADANYLSEQKQEVLMYHELRHIGIQEKVNGDLNFYIVPHDVEDFIDIINDYGIGWEND